MKKKPKAAPFQNKGWMHYQAIWNLLPTKPSGLNVYHLGWPMTWEENGNDLPAGDFDDPSCGGTNEDTGLHHSDEEEDGEEAIPWASQLLFDSLPSDAVFLPSLRATSTSHPTSCLCLQSIHQPICQHPP